MAVNDYQNNIVVANTMLTNEMEVEIAPAAIASLLALAASD